VAVTLEFVVWLLLIVFCGVGIYRLWAQMVPPAWVNWFLLPATVVSEMAYIFGCLITGGEIRRARLIQTSASPGGAEPATEAAAKLRFVGPLVASLLAMVACGAGIVLAHRLLGEPVMDQFRSAQSLVPAPQSPGALASWAGFWQRLEEQVRLLRRMCETFARVNWLNWRATLFVYLAAALSVRLAPVGRDLRATLSAAGLVALALVAVGAVSARLETMLQPVLPLLTYVWGSLLGLLAVTLLVRGAVGFVRICRGEAKRPARRA